MESPKKLSQRELEYTVPRRLAENLKIQGISHLQHSLRLVKSIASV
jgi:hypothetical protein